MPIIVFICDAFGKIFAKRQSPAAALCRYSKKCRTKKRLYFLQIHLFAEGKKNLLFHFFPPVLLAKTCCRRQHPCAIIPQALHQPTYSIRLAASASSYVSRPVPHGLGVLCCAAAAYGLLCRVYDKFCLCYWCAPNR